MNAKTFMIRIPHTFKSEKEVSRSTSFFKSQKPLIAIDFMVMYGFWVSPKVVVQKEMMNKFAKDPSSDLLVKENIVFAV